MKKYQLIVMSFDGEYKRETPTFQALEDLWEYSDSLGSTWYFYPFHFAVSGNTVRDSGNCLDFTIGRRIKTVQRIFAEHAKKDETQGLDPIEFALTIS